MNSVPIVTVGDLATNSFTTDKKGIDLKLSKVAGNGLKQTAEGLIYSSSGATSGPPRVLLGAFTGGTFKAFNFNNELSIAIDVQDLGSDGVYLRFGLSSSHDLQLSKFQNQNAYTYNQESGEIENGTLFESRYWDDMSNQYDITYSVAGVTRRLMLSQVRFGKTFYVWCDIICVESVGFVGGDASVGIEFAGKHYKEFFLRATYNLNLVMVEGYNEETDGYDSYLAQFSQNGLMVPVLSFPYVEHVSSVAKYNYSFDVLAIVHDEGGTLRVIANGLSNNLTIQTERSNGPIAIDIYPDSTSDDVLIAVSHSNDNAVDIYRLNTVNYTLVKDSSIAVDFAALTANTNGHQVMTLKVLSSDHVGLTLLLIGQNGSAEYKAVVYSAVTINVVEEKALRNSSTLSGVENQNWVMDVNANNMLQVFAFSETGISVILEHQLNTFMFPLTNVANGIKPEGIVKPLAGYIYYNWGGVDVKVVIAHDESGTPALNVVNLRLTAPLDDSAGTIGYGELMLNSNPFIAAINKVLNPILIPVTVVE